MRSREKCGCVHDGHKWLNMCDVHRTEFNDTHERWAIEHIERQPDEVIDSGPNMGLPVAVPCAQTQPGSHHCTCGQYAKPGCQARWKRDGTYAVLESVNPVTPPDKAGE
jgi:hypothetical protein